MPYSQAEIDRIKSVNPILDIFEELFPGHVLKKSGSVHTGLCPRHANTDTPAFSLWRETGTWRCFSSCETGGDVIDLVRWAKGFDFDQAMEWLGGQKDKTTDPVADEETRQAREAKRKAEEAIEVAQAEKIRQDAIQRQVWAQWNTRMTEAQRAYWENERGIPREWQDFWQLGYTENFLREWYRIDSLTINEDPRNLSAYTIPYFDLGGSFQTVQLRFEHPNGRGKYQFVKHLGTAASISNPGQDLKFVVLHEGVLKARIAYLYGSEGGFNTISYPSEADWKAALPLLKDTEVAVVWGDPGSWLIPREWKPSNGEPGWIAHPLRLGKAIKTAYPGIEALVVDYGHNDATDKVDDMLLRGDLDAKKYRHIIDTARPLSRIRVLNHGVRPE
jgi:hypothetical protein